MTLYYVAEAPGHAPRILYSVKGMSSYFSQAIRRASLWSSYDRQPHKRFFKVILYARNALDRAHLVDNGHSCPASEVHQFGRCSSLACLGLVNVILRWTYFVGLHLRTASLSVYSKTAYLRRGLFASHFTLACVVQRGAILYSHHGTSFFHVLSTLITRINENAQSWHCIDFRLLLHKWGKKWADEK